MLITNAVCFTGEGFQEGLRVRVENGVITEAEEGLLLREGEEELDLQGDYLLPGFVDVHIHGSFRQDTMLGEEAVRIMSRNLAKQGVGAFCPTTMSASPEDTRSAVHGVRAVMARQEKNGARVLGAHMEAPFLQEERAGAQLKEYFTDPDWDRFVWQADGHPEAVRLITLAPERTGAEAFVRRATEAGVRVSVGHTSADSETVHRAADWGADHVTHTFNAQTPIHHRKPGVPGAALTDDRYYCEMICDGIHLHPDVIRLIVRCKGPKRAVAITDALEAAGMGDGEYTLGGQTVYVKNGEARLEDGTLAGSVLTMKNTLMNLIHRFGIPPETACAVCTVTPAESIGEPLAGRIAAGAPGILTRWTPDWDFVSVIGAE